MERTIIELVHTAVFIYFILLLIYWFSIWGMGVYFFFELLRLLE